MDNQLLKNKNLVIYRLYNAYIQSYIINSFINSLALFLEPGKESDYEFNAKEDNYGTTAIGGAGSFYNRYHDFAQSQAFWQNGGNMENKQNKPNGELNAADKIDKQKTAVALSYDPADAAPKVLASGKGYLAEKIIQKAKETDIPLHKDEQLAHSLSKLEIGEMIPPQLYDVVAEILAFVDKMDRIREKVKLHE